MLQIRQSLEQFQRHVCSIIKGDPTRIRAQPYSASPNWSRYPNKHPLHPCASTRLSPLPSLYLSENYSTIRVKNLWAHRVSEDYIRSKSQSSFLRTTLDSATELSIVISMMLAQLVWLAKNALRGTNFDTPGWCTVFTVRKSLYHRMCLNVLIISSSAVAVLEL